MLKKLKELASPSTYAGLGLLGAGVAADKINDKIADNKFGELTAKLNEINEKNRQYAVSSDLYNDLRDSLGVAAPHKRLNDYEAAGLGLTDNAGYYDRAAIKNLMGMGFTRLTDDIRLDDIKDTGIVCTAPGQDIPGIIAHELGHGYDDYYGSLYDRNSVPKSIKLGSAALLLSPLTAFGLRRLGLKKLPTAAITAGTAAVPLGIGANKHWNEIITDENDANKAAEQGLKAIYDKHKDRLPPDLMDGGFEDAREAALNTYKTAKNYELGSLAGATLKGIGAGTLALIGAGKLRKYLKNTAPAAETFINGVKYV